MPTQPHNPHQDTLHDHEEERPIIKMVEQIPLSMFFTHPFTEALRMESTRTLKIMGGTLGMATLMLLKEGKSIAIDQEFFENAGSMAAGAAVVGVSYVLLLEVGTYLGRRCGLYGGQKASQYHRMGDEEQGRQAKPQWKQSA